ncbi:MAG: hypothetical protein H6760_02570 [Candidatus Nomurabacteria bacterium]|nr:MAG: hypothetical protein H6760_02570 [Candidatus Nomurabacteria bacterium]
MSNFLYAQLSVQEEEILELCERVKRWRLFIRIGSTIATLAFLLFELVAVYYWARLEDLLGYLTLPGALTAMLLSSGLLGWLLVRYLLLGSYYQGLDREMRNELATKHGQALYEKLMAAQRVYQFCVERRSGIGLVCSTLHRMRSAQQF